MEVAGTTLATTEKYLSSSYMNSPKEMHGSNIIKIAQIIEELDAEEPIIRDPFFPKNIKELELSSVEFYEKEKILKECLT